MSTRQSQYVAWLICLNGLMDKVRRHGWLAIEEDVESPGSPGSSFSGDPVLMRQPYLDFTRDLLRLRLTGYVENAMLSTYAQQAIATLSRRNWLGQRPADQLLINMIWSTLHAFFEGLPPAVACEFGRQVIPLSKRPDHGTLEFLLAEARQRALIQALHASGERDLDAEADAFIRSLSR